jgi:mono/diheme cytochrome c family protein
MGPEDESFYLPEQEGGECNTENVAWYVETMMGSSEIKKPMDEEMRAKMEKHFKECPDCNEVKDTLLEFFASMN